MSKSRVEFLQAQITVEQRANSRLTEDNEQLKVEVERYAQNCCSDCLEYKDDGTPQTSYGWNENREEGQIPCGCISESGPYQVLEEERDKLKCQLESLTYCTDMFSVIDKLETIMDDNNK